MATSIEVSRDELLGDRLYLRVKTVHEITGLSEPEIYKAIYARELRARKYKSRVWLITPQDLEAWIAAHSDFNIV